MQNHLTLRDILRRAHSGNLPEGWIYLPTSDAPGLDTECLLLDDQDGECDDRGIPLAAVERGFTHEGLDGETTVSTAQWATQFADPPPDDLLLESFLYYWRFDAL